MKYLFLKAEIVSDAYVTMFHVKVPSWRRSAKCHALQLQKHFVQSVHKTHVKHEPVVVILIIII